MNMKRNLVFGTCAAVLSAFMALVACDPVPDNGDGTTTDNPLLEDAARALEAARTADKTVSALETTTSGNGGFVVTFTDGTSVQLGNAGNDPDGVTPLLSVGTDGCWTVSYNGGQTLDRILTGTGQPLDAADVGARVMVADDGRFVYQFHTPGYPDKVIHIVPTLLTSHFSRVLQSAVKDPVRGNLLLTLADGSFYTFRLESVWPTEISLLTYGILLGPKDRGRLDFAVHPQEARFTPVVDGNAPNLYLLGTGGAAPVNFRITKAEQTVDDAGRPVAGRYSATVEDLGLSSEYTESAVLVLETENGQGGQARLQSPPIEISVSSVPCLRAIRIGAAEGVERDGVFYIKLPYGTNVKALRPEYVTNGANVLVKDAAHDFTPASSVDFSNPVIVRVVASSGESKDYTVVIHYSFLPVVYVTTPSAITSKDKWTEACGIRIWNAGDLNGTYDDVQMKGRGNSTWGYAKKPYAIKLNKKAEVLGMKKHKRWCLLANYLDHTCMRNAVAFEIARRLPGLEWTPNGRFVELVMNGEFLGNYYLCEQIKVDENRVNVAEISPKDIDGEAVTGGYLFELDSYYDEQFKFRTAYRNLPVQFKDPDEDIATEQFDYVRDYFNTIESILYGKTEGDVFDYIDLDSFVDWFLVNTLTGNREPKHPKSSYMNKDRGGKLKAGPVWDYDWETFLPNNEGLINKTDMWYDALFRNETFVKRLKERWNACKADVRTVGTFIDDTQAEIRESAEYNLKKWPLSGNDVNGDGSLSFDAAVARLKQAFQQKYELNDKAINAL